MSCIIPRGAQRGRWLPRCYLSALPKSSAHSPFAAPAMGLKADLALSGYLTPKALAPNDR